MHSSKQNASNSTLTFANPRGVERYLARLRKPARFHLELTAPGVSGGQVLPHNDRSRHTLARGQTGCDVRKNSDKKRKENPKKKISFPLAGLTDPQKALPVSGLRRTQLHASRRCFPARWRRQGRGEGEGGYQRRRGKEKSLTRVGGSHRKFLRRLIRAARGWLEWRLENGETRDASDNCSNNTDRERKRKKEDEFENVYWILGTRPKPRAESPNATCCRVETPGATEVKE